jgi:hypothetical protein
MTCLVQRHDRFEASDVQVMGEDPNPDPDGDPLDNVGFVFFRDPDGSWAVQQISTRARDAA